MNGKIQSTLSFIYAVANILLGLLLLLSFGCVTYILY